MILSLVWFAFDQGTKYWITAHSGFIRGYYPPASGIEIIPGFFSLVYTVNPGAAWGMFAGAGGMLVLFAVIVLFIIFFFRVYLELEKPLHQVCFGLIVGGILGNTMDRIFYGYVIDFLDVHLGFYRWPTFNIADSGIVVGTLLYLVVTWSPKKHSS